MADLRLASEVIERARAGDAAAVNLILEHLWPVYKEFFERKSKSFTDRSIVHDLVHNALLRLRKSLKGLRKTESLMAYAMKNANYELHDMYRRRGQYAPKEVPLAPEKMPEQAPSSSSSAADERLDVDSALNSLTPRARRVLELKVHGYRYREIAELLDTTEAAVKMQVKRAFKAMRKALSD